MRRETHKHTAKRFLRGDRSSVAPNAMISSSGCGCISPHPHVRYRRRIHITLPWYSLVSDRGWREALHISHRLHFAMSLTQCLSIYPPCPLLSAPFCTDVMLTIHSLTHLPCLRTLVVWARAFLARLAASTFSYKASRPSASDICYS